MDIDAANVKAATLCLSKLEKLRVDLEGLDASCANAIATDDEALIADIERSQLYESELTSAISELTYNLSQFRAQNTVAQANISLQGASQQSHAADPQSRGARHKLLEVDIVKFDGEPAQWEEFWDDFVATVDSKPQYSPVEKLKILKASLEGEAKGVLKGFLLTEANYEQAKEALKQRCANKQLRRFAHFEALLAIPPADHQTSKLREMSDQCEANIRSLIALGMDEDKFGEVFIPILLSKLPRFVRMEISRKNGTSDWTLHSLRTLLKNEIDIRDTCEKTSWAEKEQKAVRGRGHYKPEGRTTASALVVSEVGKSKLRCAFCQKPHESQLCRTYADVASRRAQISSCCYSCLGTGHFSRYCPNKVACPYCGRMGHHSSLCFDKFLQKKNANLHPPAKASVQVVDCQTPNVVDESSGDYVGIAASERRVGRAILETAVASVKGTRSEAKARMVFDTASTMSFITVSLAKQIGAKSLGEQVSSVGRFSDRKRSSAIYRLYEVDVLLPGGSRKRIVVNGVDVISTPVQLVPISAAHRNVLSSVTLAEPLLEVSRTVEIELLVGLDWYHEFFEEAQIRLTDQLVLKKSILGWIASGFERGCSHDRGDVTHVILATEGRKAETFDVERFWALNEIGIRDDPGSVDDETALRLFKETIKFEDGRYQVRWPFKEPKPNLSTNKALAMRRLKSLWGKLKGQPQALAAYDQIIADQLLKQIIEVAPVVPDGLEHYLPHHAVVKESSATTKLRVVYDASAKASRSSLSLNDCLYRGPVLMNDLCGILIRARMHPVGILSDVEKAYLQVGLQVMDRDVTRFFWFRNSSEGISENNIVCYRFRRVLFGLRPSAFMLSGTLAVHIARSGKPVAKELDGNIYVDNAFVGKSDTLSAMEFYHEAKELLGEASMNLREWFSNDEEFMQSIPEIDRGRGDVTQLLGIKWHLKSDELSSQPKFTSTQKPTTKRLVLKAIATVYDPCGWFCPVTISGKILMQELWLRKCDWDVEIPEDLRAKWDDIWLNFEGISEFRIQRCIDRRTADPGSVIELHAFCDASARAYAAAIYVRVSSSAGVTVNLAFAKSRVSPANKQLSIPRLELVGVVVGLRLLHFVAKELRLPVGRKVIWTDSKCLLHWIPSTTVQTTFVENRLREIRRSVGTVEFRYVPTADNPADIPTRGSDVESLRSNTLWWNGPCWLLNSEANWPPNVELSSQHTAEIEVAGDATIAVAVDAAESVVDVTRFSSLLRLLRVTAWVLRFVTRLKGEKPDDCLLTATEMRTAELFWVKRVQRQTMPGLFGGEVTRSVKNQQAQLGLSVGDEGIVRCHGRLEHAELSEDQRRPIYLAHEHPFTKLVVRQAHSRVLHSGVANTLAEVRSRYWIPRGRVLVKQVIRECLRCRRSDGGPFRVPDAPSLPPERVVQSAPFAIVGLDYAGPLFIRSGEGTVKVWIALFTCAVVRAVHIEVAEGLSASDFLFCLRRFVATRGAPNLIISDNAPQFRLSSQLFAKSWSKAVSSRIVKKFCAESGIEWKFIPEMAPWMGGFYERMVKPVKEARKKSLGQGLVELKELSTLVAEVATMINSRPLTYLETDVGDRPLSPLDFLRVAEPVLSAKPPGHNFLLGRGPTAQGLAQQWVKSEKQLDRCWQDFRSKYLLSLRQQHCRHRNRNSMNIEPKVGMVVLVKDSLPRLKWKIGRITHLRLSRDNVCRSVELRVGNGHTLVRPIKLLYPLECSVDQMSTDRDAQISRDAALQWQVKKVAAQTVSEEEGFGSEDGSVEY